MLAEGLRGIKTTSLTSPILGTVEEQIQELQHRQKITERVVTPEDGIDAFNSSVH